MSRDPSPDPHRARAASAPRARRVLAAVAALALGSAVAPPVLASGGSSVTNVGIGMDPRILVVEGRRAAFGAEEWREGVDLNGDGDLLDVILFAYDAATGHVANLEVALDFTLQTRAIAWYGAELLAIANEAHAKIDYNGDGDRTDVVLVRVVPATGATTFLLVGVSGVRVAGDYAIVTRSEFHFNASLNGDADRVDQVLATLHIARRKLASLRLAVFHVDQIATTSDRLAFLVSELYEGRDLNADGDTSDEVVFVHDVGTSRTTNTKLAGDLTREPAVRSRRVPGPLIAFSTRESYQGADLNGDGDLGDEIPYYIEPTDHTLYREIPGSPAVPRGTSLPLAVAEASHGADVNGDGDAVDSVVAFGRYPGGGRWITGLALRAGAGSGWSIDTLGRAVHEVDEAASGNQDLNGDGDATDLLVARLDPALEVAEVFDVASYCSTYSMPTVVRGERVLACEQENLLGEDLTGDGDTYDLVAVSLDMTTGQARSSGLAMQTIDLTPRMVGDIAYLPVPEFGQGKDLNGDGDTLDRIVHRFDTSSGDTDSTALQPYALLSEVGWQAGTHELFVAAWEGSGGGDYNGDGDTGDYVLHVVR